MTFSAIFNRSNEIRLKSTCIAIHVIDSLLYSRRIYVLNSLRKPNRWHFFHLYFRFFCIISDETDHTYSACDFLSNSMQLYTECIVEEAYIVGDTDNNYRIAAATTTTHILHTTIRFEFSNKQNVSIFFINYFSRLVLFVALNGI